MDMFENMNRDIYLGCFPAGFIELTVTGETFIAELTVEQIFFNSSMIVTFQCTLQTHLKQKHGGVLKRVNNKNIYIYIYGRELFF